jgi:hypothetical protein
VIALNKQAKKYRLHRTPRCQVIIFIIFCFVVMCVSLGRTGTVRRKRVRSVIAVARWVIALARVRRGSRAWGSWNRGGGPGPGPGTGTGTGPGPGHNNLLGSNE